jgi:hypothetical protein
MTDGEPEYQYLVHYGRPTPLPYWSRTELVPGVVIDTPGHPLKVLRVTVPAELRLSAAQPGKVGEAQAEAVSMVSSS